MIKSYNRDSAGFILSLFPAIAVTTEVISALGMGIAVSIVLICTCIVVSVFHERIPQQIYIPFYLLIATGFVCIVMMFMSIYMPQMLNSLKIYLPIVAVGYIVLRHTDMFMEDFSESLRSAFTEGFRFTVILVITAAIREFLGNGTFLGFEILRGGSVRMLLLAPGGFLVLAFIIAAIQGIGSKQ